MSIIKLKRSNTAAASPTGLAHGEVAVNITDKKIFIGNSTGGTVLLVDGSTETIQDSAASLFTTGTHTGISVSYPDTNNAINLVNTGVLSIGGSTGVISAADGRTSLGLVIGTDVQGYNATLDAVAAGTYTGTNTITTLGTIGTGVWQGTAIADTYISSAATWNTASTDRFKWDGGATGLVAATGRTSLGLVIGTDVQGYNATLATVAAGTYTGTNTITTLGTITTGTWSASTITVSKGGTGTTTGNITGTGALTFTAGGSDTNINLVPLGTGTVDVGTKRITGLASPTNNTDAANKNYVDSLSSGINWHQAVTALSDVQSASTYVAGTTGYDGGTGVGAYIEANANGALTAVDSVSVVVGNRLLMTGRTNTIENGIYTVTSIGSAGTKWRITRATDMDGHDAASTVIAGDAVYVTSGTDHGNLGWIETGTGTGTGGAHIIGTDGIVWTQFTGTASFVAGDGLSVSGKTLSVNVDGTTLEINTDTLRIKPSSLTTLGIVTSGTWTATAIADSYISSATTWNTAYTDRNKWDGGATGLTASTGRTSLGLVIGTDVQAYSATLAAAAGGTYTGNVTGNVSGSSGSCTGNAATATNVAYTGLTGTVPTWNQNTTGNAATATNVAYTGLTGTVPTWNQNTTGNAATVTDGAYVSVDSNFVAFQTFQDGIEVISDATVGGTLTAGAINALGGTINGVSLGVIRTNSTVLGVSAGAAIAAGGTHNTLVGYQAGDSITTGDFNIAIGSDALGAASTAVDCIAIGYNALLLNTASGNIAIGSRALDAVTTGTGNFAAGTDAASAINTGTNNFALGTNALKVATTVSDNVAIGFDALQGKTTSGNGNVAIGTSAMYRATTNTQSTAVGYQSQFGSAAVTGSGNTSLGYNSMVSITSAGYNSAFGIQALYALTSGAQNTACGVESVYAITTTSNNTGVGTAALRNITNGANNIGIGHSAARYKTAAGTTDHTLSGDNNIYIGYQSRASGDSVTKEVVIGSVDALGLGSNTTVIGTSTTLGNRIFGVASTGQVAPTIASATTIAPTTSIVFISGTTAVVTITAPSTIATTGGQIILIPTGLFTTTAAGNIALASTAVVSKALIMTYDAATTKWYPSY